MGVRPVGVTLGSLGKYFPQQQIEAICCRGRYLSSEPRVTPTGRTPISPLQSVLLCAYLKTVEPKPIVPIPDTPSDDWVVAVPEQTP